MYVNHFAALTFFAERGLVGGHVYQPNVNHRMMNFENLSASRVSDNNVVVMPMLRSMIFNKGKSSFSTNSSMQLSPYNDVPASEDTAMLLQLMSPEILSFDTFVSKDLEDLMFQSVDSFMGGNQDDGSNGSMDCKDLMLTSVFCLWGKKLLFPPKLLCLVVKSRAT